MFKVSLGPVRPHLGTMTVKSNCFHLTDVHEKAWLKVQLVLRQGATNGSVWEGIIDDDVSPVRI